MEYAIDVTEGTTINAQHADRSVGYLCASCKHPVFLKSGIEKVAHFSHHNDKVDCPEYHQGSSRGSFTKLITNYRAILGDDIYIARWNSIVRFILDHDAFEHFAGYPRIIFPVMNYLETVRLETKERKTILIKFLETFGQRSLDHYDCRPERLRGQYLEELRRGQHRIPETKQNPVTLKQETTTPLANPAKSSTLPAKPKAVTGNQQIESYKKLDALAKFKHICSLVEKLQNGQRISDSQRELLAFAQFSPTKSHGQFFTVPLSQLASSKEAIPILKELKRETLKEFIESVERPERQKAFLTLFYERRFYQNLDGIALELKIERQL